MPIPRNYKEFVKDPKKCKLFSNQILKVLVENNMEIFKASDVANIFGLCLAEACTRINVLKRYGWIKATRPKTYPASYQVTKWGKKYYSFKFGDSKNANGS